VSGVAALLGHQWRRHRAALGLLAAGNAFFAWAITRVVPDPSRTGVIRELVEMAPAPIRVFLGDELVANLSARGFLGFGYVHPFPLILLGVWAVRVATGALAGETGRGTMDLIASRPVARGSQLAAAAVAVVAGVVAIAAAGWAGTAAGLLLRPLAGVTAVEFLPVAAMSAILFSSVGAVCLLVSSAGREGGTAISWCAGLLAGSYVLDYLARVWGAIAFLRPLSPFRYYEPQRILREGIASTDVVVLAAVALAAVVLAWTVFARRDLA
jgi:ABC-2 type transport system permease protein